MEIKTDKSAKTLLKIMKAFHAALVRVSDGEKSSAEYRVDGSAVFNAVIQLCVLELGAAVRRYLKLPVDSKQAPHKCKRFVKIRTALKGYLLDLLKVSMKESERKLTIFVNLHESLIYTISKATDADL